MILQKRIHEPGAGHALISNLVNHIGVIMGRIESIRGCEEGF